MPDNTPPINQDSALEALDSLEKQMRFQDYYGGIAANFRSEQAFSAQEFLDEHYDTIKRALQQPAPMGDVIQSSKPAAPLIRRTKDVDGYPVVVVAEWYWDKMDRTETGWKTIDSAPRDKRIVVALFAPHYELSDPVKGGIPQSKRFGYSLKWASRAEWKENRWHDGLETLASPNFWLDVPLPAAPEASEG